MTTYDAWQSTFFFSMLSNLVGGKFTTAYLGHLPDYSKELPAACATAEVALSGELATAISGALAAAKASGAPLDGTDWQVVWGPQTLVVAPVPLSHDLITGNASFDAANAMVVFHSVTQKRYVAAIAATNFVSGYDWLNEDFATDKVVSWTGAFQGWAGQTITDQPSSSVACISQATWTGIDNLLGMTWVAGSGQTLMQYLGSVDPTGQTLTFTGHSLAGALSPTLTMAAFDPTNGLLKASSWKASQAQFYATAGATPGNQLFANLVNGAGFAAGQGAQPWQIWNYDLHNNLDIVPRAWVAASMTALPTIYSSYYGAIDIAVLNAAVNKAVAQAAKGEQVAGPYTPVNNASLNGVQPADAANEFFYDYIVTISGKKYHECLTLPQAAASADNPKHQTTISWSNQLKLQHTTAYGQLILGRPPQPGNPAA